jgi:putative flippase GtrA
VWRFSRFLVSGAINTIASYALYLLLLIWLPYLAAYTIAYVAGIASSYLLMTKFVFRTPPKVATAIRFPLVYVVQYAVGSAVVVVLVEWANVRASIAAIVAIVVSIPFTYLTSRFLLRG